MNMMAQLTAVEPSLSRTEVAGLVALAARTVPPIWPLESAIAVNPLAGFEDLPFEEAVELAGRRFGARRSLPLFQWRKLLAQGKIEERVLRDVAINGLGGIYAAIERAGPDISRLDLLMARLLHMPAAQNEPAPASLTPDAAFIAKWCAAFFDQRQAACPMPYRELGLYRATLAAIGYDPEYQALAGATGQQLLLSVPRDPLEAIAEGIAALGIDAGQEQDRLADLVARLPGWAGHIRWRNENADPDIAESAPASMADLLALWLLLDRGGAVSTAATPPAADESAALAAYFGLTATELASLGEKEQARFAAIAEVTDDKLGCMFQTAAEWTYRNALAPKLQSAATRITAEASPDAQLVFCIDVRSEPFRRALEAQGNYETYGYAGFFGLPIALHRHGETRRTRLLPVLLSPQHDIAEAPAPGREKEAAALAARQARMTAPMVVAQWINCQYLFSTIDNDRYGSGDKTTQNVVGGIGVQQGNGGDLRVGLPKQSLFTDEGVPFHIPQRLLAVVLAPFDRVERVVESNDILGRLLGNGWITLVSIDPRTGKALRWRHNREPSTEGTIPLDITPF